MLVAGRDDVKKARLVLDLQGRGWRAFALRAYRRDHVNMFPFLSRGDKMGRLALPDQDTARFHQLINAISGHFVRDRASIPRQG